MRVARRSRVGCVSSSCLLLALACSSETPAPSATGGAPSATGGAPGAGGTSTGGTAPSTGGAAPSTGGAAPSTGGTAPSTGGAAPSTGGTAPSTGGASNTGGSNTGGASMGGGGTAGAQGGGTTSMGGNAGGAGGKGAAGAGAGGVLGTGGAAGAASGGSGGATGFTLTSPAWTTQAGCAPDNKAPCGIFPKANTNLNGGKNESPELDWSGAPSTAQSYAIVLQDLSNLQQGNPFIHWVMWNIPSSVNKLPAALEKTAMPTFPAGSSQRAYSGNGFMGSGKCGNVYEFVLFALPMATFTPTGTITQTSVATALKATGAPTATLRGRSGAPECTE